MHYHSDGLGSVRAVTNAVGDTAAVYDYDVFGEPRFVSNSTPSPFRFTGEQLDPSTGLYNLRARYYAPAIGRFMSRDPFPGLATNPQTQHPYAYVANSPLNWVDPSGLYGYRYFFYLGRFGPSGPSRAMAVIQQDFSVWPVRVEPQDPGPNKEGKGFQTGQRYDLFDPFNVTDANPVEVLGMTDTSLIIKSLPGHFEGPDNIITFTTHLGWFGTTWLEVKVRGPITWRDIPVINIGTQGVLPYGAWQTLAFNVRGRLQ